MDCTRVVWLDKEVFPDPPEGKRRTLDLVGKVPTRVPVPGWQGEPAESWLTLVHIEIEARDSTVPLRSRMYEYYQPLREKYQLPVLPIVIYLQVGADGTGIDVYTEQLWELEVVRFQYLYVGLPALDAVKYVQGDIWLGVA